MSGNGAIINTSSPEASAETIDSSNDVFYANLVVARENSDWVTNDEVIFEDSGGKANRAARCCRFDGLGRWQRNRRNKGERARAARCDIYALVRNVRYDSTEKSLPRHVFRHPSPHPLEAQRLRMPQIRAGHTCNVSR